MSYLINLFLLDSDPSLLLFGTYNPWLVVLSLVVATFTSGMALQLAGVARISRSPLYRELALATGAVALGGGVWAMHFIGMLSLQLCATVRYDPVITCLSVLPSLAASRVALGLLARRVVSPLQLIVGGVLVGGGIGTMHYSGMAAMQMAPLLRYDPLMFALSILVAVLLAIIALWVRFGLRGRMSSQAAIVIGGVVMGLAISGMHYTGMAAARFVGAQEFAEPRGVDGGFYLALAVAMATLTLSVAAGAVMACCAIASCSPSWRPANVTSTRCWMPPSRRSSRSTTRASSVRSAGRWKGCMAGGPTNWSGATCRC